MDTDPQDYVRNAVDGDDSHFMAGSVIGIFGIRNGVHEHQGSGTLVEIGNVPFIATAGHFEFEKDGLRGPFFYRSTLQIPKRLQRDPDIEDLSLVYRQEEGYDFGAIQLCQNHSLGGWAIGLDRFRTISGTGSRPFMVQGYPADLDEMVQQGSLVEGTVVLPTLQLAWLREDRRGHVFEYRETGIGGDGEVIRYPRPYGLSGGPIWHVDDMRSWNGIDPPGLRTIDTRTVPPPTVDRKALGVSLFAIQSSWWEVSRTSYGVCSQEWLRFLSRWKPELASVIEAFFKPS